MQRFNDFADAGRQLQDRLLQELDVPHPWVLCPIVPNGSAVLAGMAWDFDVVAPIRVDRSADGVEVHPLEHDALAGACVIVIDDGVETGTVARAVVPVIRAAEPSRLVLAVPVCPQEAVADLQHRYDQVVAVVKPFVRRDLRWHYVKFEEL